MSNLSLKMMSVGKSRQIVFLKRMLVSVFVKNAAWKVFHYSDVIRSTMASQITSHTIVHSTVYIQAQIKENIKARRHWLCVRGIHR